MHEIEAVFVAAFAEGHTREDLLPEKDTFLCEFFRELLEILFGGHLLQLSRGTMTVSMAMRMAVTVIVTMSSLGMTVPMTVAVSVAASRSMLMLLHHYYYLYRLRFCLA